jgi:hypothetical protein
MHRDLNQSLAWFVRDLFSVMDRGSVFELVRLTSLPCVPL